MEVTVDPRQLNFFTNSKGLLPWVAPSFVTMTVFLALITREKNLQACKRCSIIVCRVALIWSNSALSSAKSTSLMKNDLVLVFIVVAISCVSLGLIQDHYSGITHMLWDLSMLQIENQEHCTYEKGWCILVLFQNFGLFLTFLKLKKKK